MKLRRNSDGNIRDLEKEFFSNGGEQAQANLVSAYVRSGFFPLFFLLENPSSFQMLPIEIQDTLRNIVNGPEILPTQQNEEVAEEDYDDYDYEDEDEDDEVDEALELARERGEVWECDACGNDDLYEGNQGEEWQLLSEDAAKITTAKLGRGSEGVAMCEECLEEAGLELGEASSTNLGDTYCLDCGETHEDCSC